jgi:two-component system, sensor histidine kinase YesM
MVEEYMGFQTKLILTYSLFIIVLVIILGTIFYKHSESVFEANAYSNLSVISDKMSKQFEKLILPMEFISEELLSDGKFISSLTSLATLDRNNIKSGYYLDDARQYISSKLLTYSIIKNFYQVDVFNNKGDFLSSSMGSSIVNEESSPTVFGLKWEKSADMAKGKIVILPPYTDPWTYNGAKVFSTVRSVQFPESGMGYIEVQNRYSDLKKIFNVPDETNTKVVAITNNGEVLYNNGVKNAALLKYYTQMASNIKEAPAVVKNRVSGKDEIVVGIESNYTGIKIIIAEDKATLLKPLLFTAETTLMMGIIIIFISFIYIYIFTRRLARPIRQLKYKMENTELENLPEEMVFESSNNEIEALNNSFQRLRERLNEAVRQEIKSQSLQMRANFNSLQAQINPHFIYNILNVLSNKGIENGDEEICEICDSIAGMLRYSTSTLKRSATIAEELEHVRNYLILMKKRYEHRLEFNIEVDESIYNEPIPKIVLQQIVENSVNHGFSNGQKIVKVEIKGHVKDGWWYIDFTDNGQGFELEMLNKLEKRMESMKVEISKGESKTGFAIGGMGLINTFGRLVLFYNSNFAFTLKNIENGGALVTIGGVVGMTEEVEDK